MRRQLLWLLAGLVMLPVLLLATAPELIGADLSAAVSLLGIVLAAGVPGLILLGVVAVRRRRASSLASASDGAAPAPTADGDPVRTTDRDITDRDTPETP
ncbi:MAG: hypothetical protein WDZ26_04715 [Nitriliruptoraceae bacterium]